MNRRLMTRRTVHTAALLRTTLCLAAVCLTVPLVHAQYGPSIWGARDITTRDLRKRARFNLLVAPRFRLVRAQLVWVPHDKDTEPSYPSRQAACLYYDLGAGHKAIVAQAAAVRDITIANNVMTITGDGFFFRHTNVGDEFRIGRIGGTDYEVIAKDKPTADRLERALQVAPAAWPRSRSR